MASGPKVYWVHNDPVGLEQAVGLGLQRAEQGNWALDDASRADLRALLLGACVFASALSSKPPYAINPASMQGDGEIVIPQAPSDGSLPDATNRAKVQLALVKGASGLLAAGKDVTKLPSPPGDCTIVTSGGLRDKGFHMQEPSGADGLFPTGSQPAEAGSVLLVAFAVVVIVGAVSSVWYLIHSEDDELANNQLAADAKVKEHAQAVGAAVSLVKDHLAREDHEGKHLAWDPAELATIDKLLASSNAIAQWQPPALQTVPHVAAVTEAVGGAVKSAGEGLGGGLLLLGLGLAYFATH